MDPRPVTGHGRAFNCYFPRHGSSNALFLPCVIRDGENWPGLYNIIEIEKYHWQSIPIVKIKHFWLITYVSLWAKTLKIYFYVSFIRLRFLGTKLKLIISRLNLDRGTFFKVVRKRLERANSATKFDFKHLLKNHNALIDERSGLILTKLDHFLLNNITTTDKIDHQFIFNDYDLNYYNVQRERIPPAFTLTEHILKYEKVHCWESMNSHYFHIDGTHLTVKLVHLTVKLVQCSEDMNILCFSHWWNTS